MSRPLTALALVLVGALPAAAQLSVYDPAVTARNIATAIVKEYLVTTQRNQQEQLERMSRRLSRLTNLGKYSLPNPPAWRTHDLGDEGTSSLARDYRGALSYGDRTGRAILAVSHDVQNTVGLLNRLSPAAVQALRARLATLEVADAALIASTHDAGLTRFNGRRELAAIEALEGHVIDPNAQHSATAVLEKINGSSLIGARQRQARLQLLASLVEELLVATKRARDADAAAMNMQLTTWRDGQAANHAFVAGSGDALRTWRQP